MNCLINIVLILHCSNFLSDNCLKLVYCSMVFVNCIDLHVSVLLHTFVLPLRLELKSKAQDLTQGKRSRFFLKIREIYVLFLGKNQGNSGKKSKILSEPCKVRVSKNLKKKVQGFYLILILRKELLVEGDLSLQKIYLSTKSQ